jgi:hypothetical protein
MYMATQKQLRGLLVIASHEVGEVARMEIAEAAPLRVKAVPSARMALASVGEIKPYAILVENGAAPIQAVQAVRNLAELTMSRKVPVVIFNGPLEPGIEAQRETFGIAQVLDGEYRLQPTLDALKAAIGKIDRMYRTNKIRERLRTASDRLKPVTEEDLQQIQKGPDDVQDFAAEDAAPEEKRVSEPDSPTWDGSVGE